MNKSLCTLFVAGLLAGCTPTDLMQPTFPAVPPEKSAKSDSDKPKRDARSDSRNPVSAKDITERNARQTLRDLDGEMETDLADKPAKN
jgi:hypothetical protein